MGPAGQDLLAACIHELQEDLYLSFQNGLRLLSSPDALTIRKVFTRRHDLSDEEAAPGNHIPRPSTPGPDRAPQAAGQRDLDSIFGELTQGTHEKQSHSRMQVCSAIHSRAPYQELRTRSIGLKTKA